MAEELTINVSSSKEEKYLELIPQLKGLVTDETDTIANMANLSAALKETFNFLWVGFYIVKNEELVLGPFQGPIACTRIQKGKGVCGTCWQKAETILVDDVDKFEGHIACSSLSKSEIVVPIFNDTQEVTAILDVDSLELNTFDKIDAKYLAQIVKLLQ